MMDGLLTEKLKISLILLNVLIFGFVLYFFFHYTGEISSLKNEMAEYQLQQDNRGNNTVEVLPNKILEWSLFGKQENKHAYSAEKLQVIGIFMDSNPVLRSAVVTESQVNPKLYYIGENLPGNYTLKAVYPDRVIIESGKNDSVLYYNLTAEEESAVKSSIYTKKLPPAEALKKFLPSANDKDAWRNFKMEQLPGTKP